MTQPVYKHKSAHPKPASARLTQAHVHNGDGGKTRLTLVKRVKQRRFIIPVLVIATLILGISLIYLLTRAGGGNTENSSGRESSNNTPAQPRPLNEKYGSNQTNAGAQTTPAAPSQQNSDKPNGSSAAGSSGSGGTPDPAGASGNTPPAKPYGTFVSNHKPGQNGSPLGESSLCNTSAGVNCTISFAKDGIIKSLPSKITDTDGGAYWSSWTPQAIGLTPGKWTITATAASGQQPAATAVTQDPIPLEVVP